MGGIIKVWIIQPKKEPVKEFIPNMPHFIEWQVGLRRTGSRVEVFMAGGGHEHCLHAGCGGRRSASQFLLHGERLLWDRDHRRRRKRELRGLWNERNGIEIKTAAGVAVKIKAQEENK